MADTDLQSAVKRCRGPLFLLLAFSAGINLLALASPIYMLQLYDRVLASRSIDTLVWVSMIVLAALAVLSALEAVRRIMLARLATWLQEDLTSSVLQSAVAAAESNPSLAGTAVSDLATLRGFMVGPGIIPLFDAPWTPLFLFILFAVHPLLGLIGLGSAVGLFCLALISEALTSRPSKEWGEAARREQQGAASLVQNADVIKAMGMVSGVLRRLREQAADAIAIQSRVERRNTAVLSLSRFFRLAAQTLIMGAGAWLVIQDNASAGLIFASSFLLSRALAPIDNAISTWKALAMARAAYNHLNQLLAAAPQTCRGMRLPVPQGRLQVEGLAFIPPGTATPALRGLTFQLAAGDVLAVVGPSAAGKSTLARLLSGCCGPTHGRIRLDGADLSTWQQSAGGSHVGYLPQDVALFEGSVRQNISRFTEGDSDEVVDAARLVGLHETIMGLPEGYDTQIGAGGLRLSGGMRQRVGIARAVFGHPRLVILDEPNASLDHDGESALDGVIEALRAERTTVIIVTHRPAILNQADKLLLLRNGSIDAFGGRDSVIAQVAKAHQNAQRDIRIERSSELATVGGHHHVG